MVVGKTKTAFAVASFLAWDSLPELVGLAACGYCFCSVLLCSLGRYFIDLLDELLV
jgi:hypothetical protein